LTVTPPVKVLAPASVTSPEVALARPAVPVRTAGDRAVVDDGLVGVDRAAGERAARDGHGAGDVGRLALRRRRAAG
jgi:hypothetical protein